MLHDGPNHLGLPPTVQVTAGEVGGVGAVAALLKDALQPNLVQTLEQNLALVHG